MSTTQTYVVAGMNCGHCESAVGDQVSQIAGVEHIEVSAATGELAVTTAEPVEDAIVLTAVGEAGYEAVRT